MPISSLENLPNESFYDIFEYFDACEIYHSFSSLNHRFYQLIKSSPPLLKLRLSYPESNEIFINNYQKVLLFNKKQLLSLHLWSTENTNQIASSIIFDSSFNSLQSLIFYTIDIDLLTSILPKLTCLPRLFSLAIDTWSHPKNLGDIYRLIFNLPKLKFVRFTATEADNDDVTISLPIATNEQMGSIEYLIMSHPCAFDELFAIISYTPNLRRLKFLYLSNRNVSIGSIKSMVLPNLTNLSISIYKEISFDELKIFIEKLNSKLKIFSLTTIVEDVTYLDANRWEELIRTKLPQLEEFYFRYSAYFSENYDTPLYFGQCNQFISPFWLQRRWILEIEVEFENVIYLTRPYQKRWYEMINGSDQLSKSIRLSLDETCPERWTKTIFIEDYIRHALNLTQIYHLEINAQIFSGKLMKILRLLPEVNTLKISSLSISQSESLFNEDIEFLDFLSNEKQITKICFKNMKDMNQIQMLALICSHVSHLEINCINYKHAELLTGLILTQIQSVSNSLLRLLCFRIREAHDDMILELEKMIDTENLRFDFTIKHLMDKIYIQWK
ncbi:unnamed protein product [Rotaria magnacalcarata]|uniref:F-box domain-containing protein n=2 Tax=Rotaria magnacalcarata TaxID=392030 RepID=A0A820D4Q6_9BILA|nr:unnamed protein product [Rotaria magnacalcarata]CAF4219640.1 unnamed protein product [Rotaria magnacalcarata]